MEKNIICKNCHKRNRFLKMFWWDWIYQRRELKCKFCQEILTK